jgi:FixJ family two-component response regulator
MHQGDATVSEVVRRKRGHAGRGTGTRERSSQPVTGHLLEDTMARVAVVAWAEVLHALEQDRQRLYPARPAGLCGCDPPASARLVQVAPRQRQIGTRLFLSEETVKSHVRHLLAKLQARSRAHAVAVSFRRGIIA